MHANGSISLAKRVRGRRICYEAVLIGWFESLEHWRTLWSLRVPGAGEKTETDRIPFPLFVSVFLVLFVVCISVACA